MLQIMLVLTHVVYFCYAFHLFPLVVDYIIAFLHLGMAYLADADRTDNFPNRTASVASLSEAAFHFLLWGALGMFVEVVGELEVVQITI